MKLKDTALGLTLMLTPLTGSGANNNPVRVFPPKAPQSAGTTKIMPQNLPHMPMFSDVVTNAADALNDPDARKVILGDLVYFQNAERQGSNASVFSAEECKAGNPFATIIPAGGNGEYLPVVAQVQDGKLKIRGIGSANFMDAPYFGNADMQCKEAARLAGEAVKYFSRGTATGNAPDAAPPQEPASSTPAAQTPVAKPQSGFKVPKLAEPPQPPPLAKPVPITPEVLAPLKAEPVPVLPEVAIPADATYLQAAEQVADAAAAQTLKSHPDIAPELPQMREQDMALFKEAQETGGRDAYHAAYDQCIGRLSFATAIERGGQLIPVVGMVSNGILGIRAPGEVDYAPFEENPISIPEQCDKAANNTVAADRKFAKALEKKEGGRHILPKPSAPDLIADPKTTPPQR